MMNKPKLAIFLLFFILLIAAIGSWPQSKGRASSPIRRVSVPALRQFLSQDLRTLSNAEKSKLNSVLQPLRPPTNRDFVFVMDEPWYVWEYRTAQNKPGFLIFYGQRLWMIPGQSSATVYFLDQTGILRNTVAFPTGWRIDLDSARWHYDEDLRCHCIDVRTSASINGLDVSRQMYAVHQDQLILLWIENSKGKVLPRLHADRLGTYPWIKKEAEFEQYLNSANPMHICEALWLLSNGDYEILKQPQIRTRIEELSVSSNPRLRTLALLVLKGIKKPPTLIFNGEEDD